MMYFITHFKIQNAQGWENAGYYANNSWEHVINPFNGVHNVNKFVNCSHYHIRNVVKRHITKL